MLVFLPGVAGAQETPAQREARRESQRADAAESYRRELDLRQWYTARDRIAPIDAEREQTLQRLFLQERTKARENLFALAGQIERLYLLDPESHTEEIQQEARDASETIETVRDFVTRNFDPAALAPSSSSPTGYLEATTRLADLFRELMTPMEVLLHGQVLDLQMHDLALVLLERMESLIRDLPGAGAP